MMEGFILGGLSLATLLTGILIGNVVSTHDITQEEWTKAEELCSSNQGIAKFVTKTLVYNNIVCNNSAQFTLKDEKK